MLFVLCVDAKEAADNNFGPPSMTVRNPSMELTSKAARSSKVAASVEGVVRLLFGYFATAARHN